MQDITTRFLQQWKHDRKLQLHLTQIPLRVTFLSCIEELLNHHEQFAKEQKNHEWFIDTTTDINAYEEHQELHIEAMKQREHTPRYEKDIYASIFGTTAKQSPIHLLYLEKVTISQPEPIWESKWFHAYKLILEPQGYNIPVLFSLHDNIGTQSPTHYRLLADEIFETLQKKDFSQQQQVLLQALPYDGVYRLQGIE